MEPAPFLDVGPGACAPDQTFRIAAADGIHVRAARWDAAGATSHAVLLTGRTEYLEKAAITAAGYVARGISVLSLDWRGQGLSDRTADNRLKGHIGDFREYQQDLDAVLAATEMPGPRILHGHSMGAAIAVAALERAEVASSVAATILTAPMFGIAMPTPMRAAAWATIRVGRVLGLLDRWPPMGDVETPYALTKPDRNVLTHDAAVWTWLGEMAERHRDLSIGMPTIGWFDAADREMRRLRHAPRLPTPSLCVLGSDEEVVDADLVRSVSAGIGARLVEIDGARHEVLIEADPMRSAAWAAIADFLSLQGLPCGAPV